MVLRQRQRQRNNFNNISKINNSSRLGGVMKTVNNFGRLCLYMEMIIYIFIGLIFMGIGIYLVRTKSKYTASTSGIIVTKIIMNDPKYKEKTTGMITDVINCKKILTAENGSVKEGYNCTYNVEYTIGGKVYSNKFDEYKLKSKRTEGERVNIKYNVDNPNDAILDQIITKDVDLNCKKILTARKSRITESYNCTYYVEYNVGGEIYSNKFDEYKIKSKRTEGDRINIQYNPKNPYDARLKQLSNKLIGIIFIVIGIILLGLGYFSYYMSKTTGGGLLFGNSCMWGFFGGGSSNSYFGRNYNASMFNN